MIKEPNKFWKISNETEIDIDPYRQVIYHNTLGDRHSNAWGTMEPLFSFSTKIGGIKQFLSNLKGIEDVYKEILHSVEYYSSESYKKNNELIFNLSPNEDIDYSKNLNKLKSKQKKTLFLYLIFLATLNFGIYALMLLNEKFIYMFIPSGFLSLILLITAIANFNHKPKLIKGQVIDNKIGKPTVINGQSIPASTFFIILGEYATYSFKENKVQPNTKNTQYNTIFQLSKDDFNKYSTLHSYVTFISSGKNEILEVLNSFR